MRSWNRSSTARAGKSALSSSACRTCWRVPSYRAGQILVESAKEPRTLWKVPLRLGQLYRSSWARTRQSNVESSPSGLTPTVDIPALKTPPTRSEGAPVVAAILDTFTEYCLRYEADLVLLTPKQWKRQLERAQPTFLLVESAWSGNNGEWRYLLTNYKSRDVNPLRDLVKHCREHGLTTVFWNKEDPPNFDVFIDAAKEFDFVFTTDADCIPKYKEICGHDRVYLMAFACQPRLHNPCRTNPGRATQFVSLGVGWRNIRSGGGLWTTCSNPL